MLEPSCWRVADRLSGLQDVLSVTKLNSHPVHIDNLDRLCTISAPHSPAGEGCGVGAGVGLHTAAAS